MRKIVNVELSHKIKKILCKFSLSHTFDQMCATFFNLLNLRPSINIYILHTVLSFFHGGENENLFDNQELLK